MVAMVLLFFESASVDCCQKQQGEVEENDWLDLDLDSDWDSELPLLVLVFVELMNDSDSDSDQKTPFRDSDGLLVVEQPYRCDV